MERWIEYYRSIGLPENLIYKYEAYINKLSHKKIPVIFEINHLSLLLGVNCKFLDKIIYSPTNFYREFEILKKNGGKRKILAPYPSLLLIQNWIYKNILSEIPVSSYCHGFTKDKSIITNCKVHINQKEILKLDLKDFFPSISMNRIIYFFYNLGYSRNVSFYLASLCCLNNSLPQGAPTSPILSNIIARKLDNRLFKLAAKFDLKYSRYADDIVFSGDRIPTKLYEYINQIIEEEGFKVNNEKTRFYKEKSKKIITGVVISPDGLKLPRSYKRNLVLELNYILKFGYDSHISKKKIRDLNHLPSLIGKVNFWLQIEPENKFAIVAKKVLINEFRKKINYFSLD